MTPTRFIAACVQMRSTRSIARNVDQILPMIAEAANAGAQLIQTPEMTSLVERDRVSLFAQVGPEEHDAMLAALRDAAHRHAVWIHAGSLAIRVGDKIANRAFVITPEGQIAARYDKIHLFDVDLPNGESWRESNTYTGGDIATVVALPWAGLGLSICYDVRFPYLYRAEADAGASILSAPACFTKQTGEAHWVVLHRARAIENGAFMISAAQAGLHEDGRETFGHSIIVDPWGRVLAEAGDQPGVIMAEIDLAQVADARGRIPTLKHTRQFAVEKVAMADTSRLAAE
jgi:deaminated glutathione amidase